MGHSLVLKGPGSCPPFAQTVPQHAPPPAGPGGGPSSRSRYFYLCSFDRFYKKNIFRFYNLLVARRKQPGKLGENVFPSCQCVVLVVLGCWCGRAVCVFVVAVFHRLFCVLWAIDACYLPSAIDSDPGRIPDCPLASSP